MVVRDHPLRSICNAPELPSNDSSQAFAFREVFHQLRHQPWVLHRELLTVIFHVLRADISSWRKDVAVLGNVVDRSGLAEAGRRLERPLAVGFRIPPRWPRLPAPLTVGVDDPAEVTSRERLPTVFDG